MEEVRAPSVAHWERLWSSLAAEQQRLSLIQEREYSQWRARKLLALRDSEATYYSLSSERAHRAWRGFTEVLLELYRGALDREDEPYGVGLEQARSCQLLILPTEKLTLPQLLEMTD